MRLTTKGRFAVTAMIDLALHSAQGPVTLAGISQRQKISLSYLEQLFGKLRRNKLVGSVRGPGGGYRLTKLMNEGSVVDIIFAVDEPIDATQCGGKENCHNDQRCMTHDLWAILMQDTGLPGIGYAGSTRGKSKGEGHCCTARHESMQEISWKRFWLEW